MKNDVLDWQSLSDTVYTRIGLMASGMRLKGPGAVVVLRYKTKLPGEPVPQGQFAITGLR
ncbi:hypothetical protein [Primorskyibacter sp. S187A]|uniref:hypothetical protein n=1 Tax=Primorskyibacter sp. S187A TaxID=3415130 RepID=UPI003C7C06C0